MASVTGLSKYQSVLKKVRKEYPTWSFKRQQAEASKLNKSTKKVSGKKKTICAPKKVGAAAGKVKRKRSESIPRKTMSRIPGKKTSSLQKGKVLINKIQRLEVRRKEEKAKELKDLIQLEINACHDRLDALKKTVRKRSA